MVVFAGIIFITCTESPNSTDSPSYPYFPSSSNLWEPSDSSSSSNDDTDPETSSSSESVGEPGDGSSSSTQSSSSVNETSGLTACVEPMYGVPPNGINSCVKKDGKCYICNPDRGEQCLQEWVWQVNDASSEWWYAEISCEEASEGGGGETYELTCEGLAATGIAGTAITQPAVKCNGVTLSSGFNFSGAPAWASPTANTYNVTANATAGNCNGKNASCGSIIVSSVTTNTLTCTGMPTTGVAGTAITQPTVRCGSSTVSATFSGAPSWTNPTANTYTVTATATCNGTSTNASCGTLTVSPKLTCGSVTQTVTAGTNVTPPTVQCGTSALTSGITWINAPTAWSSVNQGTYNNIQARAGSGSCNGQTANCSGTLTVNPKLTCGNVAQTITTTETPTKPTVSCGSTNLTTGITWSPNINNVLAAGTYSSVTATATSGSCNGQTANCSGTITVNAPPSSSSSSGGGGSSNSLTPVTSADGQPGWASRYWDACKPSCGWSGNVPSSANPNSPIRSCNRDGKTRVGNDAASICANSSGTAYTCYSQAPFISDGILYAFAATPTNGDCGKCFQLTFRGTSQHMSPASTLSHINGKSMIIKVSNIGGDVDPSTRQFDIMIPGGGTGWFDSFSYQLGLTTTTVTTDGNSSSTNDQGVLGIRYGGLTTKCINQHGQGASLATLQSCLNTACDNAFGSRAPELVSGCKLYASWFGVANNPQFYFKQVTCPAVLNNEWTASSHTSR
uniref:cellulase n=1 Tax=uncultured bacterium contig00028 TaxID=1181517 RepID=A0A806KJ80_9BACT|nr:hypothetical protein [uncultured bacterium contig00028]